MANWPIDTAWRQGHLLPLEAIQGLNLGDSDDPGTTVGIVISHDCDLAREPAKEPNVEVILGRIIDNPKGDFLHAKNSRTLHLCYRGAPDIWVELIASCREHISKQGTTPSFADFSPRADARLTEDSFVVLQDWLAARYRRSAFPSEFDRRLDKETDLAKRLVKLLERDDAGHSILALYFDLDEGAMVERSGEDDLYSLKIIVLYPSDDEHLHAPKAQKCAEDIKALFATRTKKGDTGTKKWIELSGAIPISDRQLSVRNARLLKEWDIHYVSHRADPPQPFLK
jgi:hypothetical protein